MSLIWRWKSHADSFSPGATRDPEATRGEAVDSSQPRFLAARHYYSRPRAPSPPPLPSRIAIPPRRSNPLSSVVCAIPLAVVLGVNRSGFI